MLKNIDPLLSPELLFVLAAMGHGDEIAVTDANFPAASVAKQTGHGRVVPVPGANMPQTVAAILSVLPLDQFVEAPVRTMEADGGPGNMPPVQREAQAAVDNAAGKHLPVLAVERFAFYEAARHCYAVVLTGEPRFYGNVIIKKGAVPPGQ